MNQEILYEDIEPLILKMVPEIREEYSQFGWDEIQYPTDEWLEELHNIPDGDIRRLGATIVFENLLVPFVISLFDDEAKNGNRISDIMEWIESLAGKDDIRISGTLVDVCFCRDIIGKSPGVFIKLFQYMGPNTKQVCLDYREKINIDKDTRGFLDSI